MELSTALPENNNWLTTTTLKVVKDNGLSNKPVVREQTLLTLMNQGSDCIILRLTTFNVPKQNDFQTRDRYRLYDAMKNLPAVDF